MKKSFTLTKKIIINNIFYLFPMIILIFLIFKGFSKDIVFAEKEIAGAEINKVGISLLANLVDSRTPPSENNRLVKDAISKRIFYSNFLNLDNSSLKNKGKEALEENNFKIILNGPDNQLKINILNDLISFTGDSSNLILDPDLDTYYLMDATIYAIPQLLNRLNQLSIFLKERSLNNEGNELKGNLKLNNYIEILKNVDFTRLAGDLDTSIKEDKNFYGENLILQREVKNNLEKLDNSFKQYLAILEKINLSGKISNDELDEIFSNLISDITKFESIAIDALLEMLNQRVESIKSDRLKSLGMGLAVIMLALIVSSFITKTITKDLYELISKLKASSVEVDDNARTNKEISSKLNEVINTQASSIQEISTTTEQISKMSVRNFDNIKLSKDASVETVATAHNATNLMDGLTQTVNVLKRNNDQIIKRSQLNSKSFESIVLIMKTIEDKAKIINDIVFQTKLLSFNASVEAARAGEHGKGFSVVAEEIGSLAQVSGKAAQEIGELLESSLIKVKDLTIEADLEIKKVVDESTQNISEVIHRIDLCQNKNKEIIENSDKITMLISEVVIASEEQTKGIIEITKAINTFDVVAVRNTHFANELNLSAKTLSEKSNELGDITMSLIKMTDIN